MRSEKERRRSGWSWQEEGWLWEMDVGGRGR